MQRAPLFPLLILFAGVLPVVAQQPFGYAVNRDGSLTITNYTGHDGNVVVPDAINGAPVTGIGDNAFHGKLNDPACSSITGVVIGANVTGIGKRAFENCKGIQRFTFAGGSVTKIGVAAFRHCESLKTFTVPVGVVDIGEEAFDDCFGLEQIDLPQTVAILGGYAFYATAITNAVIPGGVKNIPKGMFSTCTRLRSVSVPAGVTNISSGAFQACKQLSDIFFYGNGPSIAPDAFGGASRPTVHHRAGTMGWGPTFQGLPTQIWSP